ncbi:MAG: hypothetical protein A2X64_09485 [Ignavibacteria bacterium GWF2_33_9]|nr:MAG: hypothetical protein A2X64_09485 [Ignavibacteria bacterium GWF2_33_9]
MKYLKSIIIALVLVGFTYAILPAEEGTTGKDIYLDKKCNLCHGIKSLDIQGKDKFPDLSDVGNVEEFNKEFLTKFLLKENDHNGKKHAIKIKATDEELSTLVDWLLTLKESK